MNRDSAGTDMDNCAEAFLRSELGRRDISADVVSSFGTILLTIEAFLLLSAAGNASEEDEVDAGSTGVAMVV